MAQWEERRPSRRPCAPIVNWAEAAWRKCPEPSVGRQEELKDRMEVRRWTKKEMMAGSVD